MTSLLEVPIMGPLKAHYRGSFGSFVVSASTFEVKWSIPKSSIGKSAWTVQKM